MLRSKPSHVPKRQISTHFRAFSSLFTPSPAASQCVSMRRATVWTWCISASTPSRANRAFSTTFQHPRSSQKPGSRRVIAPTGSVHPSSSLAANRTASGLQRWSGTLPYLPEPTIYALSTAPGRAAIAIIRISGPASLAVCRSLCPGKEDPKPRYATLRTLYDPLQSDEVLDSNALVLYFPAPRTVTGEDVLELHIHGGPAVVRAVLSAISKLDASVGSGQRSIRYAEPGEFTRRAFLNDRLDLTQVEALGDALSATTEQQRRLSVRGATGVLGKQYEGWRERLLYARGELEALIDFSEDQHFDESPSELCASVSEQVKVLQQMLQVHSENAVRGELLRNGISVSLLGAPNAGKSSLLNRVVGREAAIVSHEAGTTRDVVEIGLDIGGYLCRLGDTAGLRKALMSPRHNNQSEDVRASEREGYWTLGRGPHDTIGAVEQEGMRRAKARAAESDVVLVVLSFEQISDDSVELHLDAELLATVIPLHSTKENVLVALNKADLASPAQQKAAVQAALNSIPGLTGERIHLISCKDDHPAAASSSSAPTLARQDPGNIQALLDALIEHFRVLTGASAPDGADDPSVWQESLGASERHRVLLERCVEALDAFLLEVKSEQLVDGEEAEGEADIVVAAEHLRSAADCLARITGKGEAGDVEEVLGVVFEKFCVGK